MPSVLIIDPVSVETRMTEAVLEVLDETPSCVFEIGTMDSVRVAVEDAGHTVVDGDSAEMDIYALPFRTGAFRVSYVSRLMESLETPQAELFLQEILRCTDRRVVLHFPCGVERGGKTRKMQEGQTTVFVHPLEMLCYSLTHAGFTDLLLHDYRLTPNVILIASRPPPDTSCLA